MAIDIYTEWRGQTNSEREAQLALIFSTIDGQAGYLREAYNGEPYATRHFCPEAYEADGTRIPAAILRERLTETFRLVEIRERTIYDSTDGEIEQEKDKYRRFVEFCEEKERETGESVLVVASY